MVELDGEQQPLIITLEHSPEAGEEARVDLDAILTSLQLGSEA